MNFSVTRRLHHRRHNKQLRFIRTRVTLCLTSSAYGRIMKMQQGFSLIEVLLVLTLVTTLGLSFLEHHRIMRQLLNDWIMRADASLFLDRIDELLVTGVKQFPAPPSPYHFVIHHHPQQIVLVINWLKQVKSLKRSYVAL
jgi:prepilin-type N-terminal cleavage/methylation domain-containing protein